MSFIQQIDIIASFNKFRGLHLMYTKEILLWLFKTHYHWQAGSY